MTAPPRPRGMTEFGPSENEPLPLFGCGSCSQLGVMFSHWSSPRLYIKMPSGLTTTGTPRTERMTLMSVVAQPTRVIDDQLAAVAGSAP